MRRLFGRSGAEPATHISAGYLPAIATSLGMLVFAAWLGASSQASGEALARTADDAAIVGVASARNAFPPAPNSFAAARSLQMRSGSGEFVAP